MALNETIVSFGTGAANYGSLVGQSLAQLGQQVGQQLAMQEYRKQAAAQLPFITQQMQQATREASEGKFGDAYSKIIGLTANPSVTQNPFILPALELGMQAIKQGSSQAWFNMQNRQQGGGGTDETTPTVDVTQYGFPAIQAGAPQGTPPTTGGGGGAATARGIPAAGGTVVETDLPTGDGGAQPSGLAAPLPEGGTPQQQQAAQNVQEFISIPTDQQPNAVQTYGVTGYSGDEYEVVKFPGLEKIIPNFEAVLVPKESDEFKVTSARVGAQGQFAGATSELQNNPDRENFFKENGTKQNIETAMKVMGDKNMREVFKEFNNDIFQMRSATSQTQVGDQITYEITKPDGGLQQITESQYKAINTLAGIVPATAMGAGGTPFLFKQKAKPTEAPTAGAPQTIADKVRAKYPKTEQAPKAQQQAEQPKQLTLEEEIAQATTSAQAVPTRTATKEQLAGVERSRVSQSRSTLESEKRKLESSIYEVSRGTGKKSLKRGITKQLEDRVKERIAQIDKELEGLK